WHDSVPTMVVSTMVRSALPMMRANRMVLASLALHKRKNGPGPGLTRGQESKPVTSSHSAGPYTVADAIADYRADYLRRGGKAADRLDWSAEARILPELGAIALGKLSKARIVAWHRKMAETPARLRTKSGATQKYREADDSAEAIRRRRSTANRVLT